MAEVIVLYAPKDRLLARETASGLSDIRTLMFPVLPRSKDYRLGSRMVRVLVWSAQAEAERVSEAMRILLADDPAPLVLVLADETKPPPDFAAAARATIAAPHDEASRAAFPALVQSILDAEWGEPELPRKSSGVRRGMLALVIVGALAVGIFAGVSAWAPGLIQDARSFVGAPSQSPAPSAE